MSFLNQLKSQAEQLRDQQTGSAQDLAAVTKTTALIGVRSQLICARLPQWHVNPACVLQATPIT
jgi:hypothetical protein